MTTKIFLHKRPYTPPLFQKKNCTLHRRCFYKYPLFTTFLIIFTVDEVCYVSNKRQSLNNLAKHQYFYTRDFISLRHFEKKLALSIANVFRNIHFLSLFSKVSEVCNISSKCWLSDKSAKKYFYRRHLTPLLSFKKFFCALHRRIF